MSFENVRGAISDFAAGKMVILVDDEDRENEGDLCIAAEKVTPAAINFMAVHGRGLICLTITQQRVDQLKLAMMVKDNHSVFQTGFTVSIEAREGVSTGISARDRAHTIQVAVAKNALPADIVSPGHVFPIRARDGGVLVRTGQTEGSVDLARLAGLEPAGVICEIMNPDGTMARREDLEAFARLHELRIVSIAELIEYRSAHDTLVEVASERHLNAEGWGEVRVIVMRSKVDGSEHLVLVKGEISSEESVLVRVQSIELPADLIGLTLYGGDAEMCAARDAIAAEGKGVFVYFVRGNMDRRGDKSFASTGLSSRLENFESQAAPRVGPRMDLREFGLGAQILRLMGVRKFRLLSNHEVRIVGLEGFGLELVERLPLL